MSDPSLYVKLPMREKNERQIGQLFWVPCPLTSSSTFTLRIGSWKAGMDIKDAKLEVKKVHRPEDIGRLSDGLHADLSRMVIPELDLDSSADLIVGKVKRRPAVLIYKDCHNLRKFAGIESGIQGGASFPNKHVFAPIYSLRKEENLDSSFPEKFIQNVKDHKYPNIVFLPSYATLLKNDSMLVLSEMFVLSINVVSPLDYCIDPTAFSVYLETFNSAIVDEICLLQGKLDASSQTK